MIVRSWYPTSTGMLVFFLLHIHCSLQYFLVLLRLRLYTVSPLELTYTHRDHEILISNLNWYACLLFAPYSLLTSISFGAVLTIFAHSLISGVDLHPPWLWNLDIQPQLVCLSSFCSTLTAHFNIFWCHSDYICTQSHLWSWLTPTVIVKSWYPTSIGMPVFFLLHIHCSLQYFLVSLWLYLHTVLPLELTYTHCNCKILTFCFTGMLVFF